MEVRVCIPDFPRNGIETSAAFADITTDTLTLNTNSGTSIREVGGFVERGPRGGHVLV